MVRFRSQSWLLCVVLPLVVPATGFPAAVHDDLSGSVAIEVVDRDGPRAVIQARFAPPQRPGQVYHLYSKDLPPDGIEGVGRPTLLRVPVGGPLFARGPLVADAPEHRLASDGVTYPVYAPGPVVLRLPVGLPQGDGDLVDAMVEVTYMACSETTCLPPVEGAVVRLAVPTHPDGHRPGAVPPPPLAGGEPATETPDRQEGPAGLIWYQVRDRAGVKAVLATAAGAGRSALLDFTGPSCFKCRTVARRILPRPEIASILRRMELVEVDTDAHRDLARWQQEAFGSQGRPFFVRVDPDGTRTAWDRPLGPGDVEAIQTFAAFLGGGAGASGAAWDGWWEFLLVAVAGGLMTLLMPCTYPMIPFTIAFFTRQAAAGRRLVPLAGAYAIGIVASFVLLGVLVAGVLGSTVGNFAGSPAVNLAMGLLFLGLGLSLLGAFLLRLPGGLGNLGAARGGYLGALLMGLTFAVAAFTCTAPFAGVVLAQAVATGTWTTAVAGMTVYAAVIAAPFFVLAVSPGLLRHLPGAGSWMNEFKTIGGLVMVAAALRFLAVADHAWGIGIVGRGFCLSVWAALAALAGLYVLGLIRLHDDARVAGVGVLRLAVATTAFALACQAAAGFAGTDLGAIEAFFPD
jgi:cytochrome c biogenesis protein CcdA